MWAILRIFIMRITAISDCHGLLPKIDPCDLLIIAGDMNPIGMDNPFMQANWYNSTYQNWLINNPCNRTLCIHANHEIVAERYPNMLKDFYRNIEKDGVSYLHCESVEYQGLKVWGSPFSLPYGKSWAFMHDDEYLEKVYDQIPLDTSIIINHGPPYGILDKSKITGEICGSKSLLKALERVSPKLCCFGHLHEGYGLYLQDFCDRHTTIMANCSLLDHFVSRTELTNKPMKFQTSTQIDLVI